MKLHYQKYLKLYGKKLRKAGNMMEVLLWHELKNDKLGCRFLRQRPIGDYIVDFFCHSLNLAIEIDGSQSHDNRIKEDEKRQKMLESFGITMIRFRDMDVRCNLHGVIIAIKKEILRLEDSPPPLEKEE